MANLIPGERLVDNSKASPYDEELKKLTDRLTHGEEELRKAKAAMEPFVRQVHDSEAHVRDVKSQRVALAKEKQLDLLRHELCSRLGACYVVSEIKRFNVGESYFDVRPSDVKDPLLSFTRVMRDDLGNDARQEDGLPRIVGYYRCLNFLHDGTSNLLSTCTLDYLVHMLTKRTDR